MDELKTKLLAYNKYLPYALALAFSGLFAICVVLLNFKPDLFLIIGAILWITTGFLFGKIILKMSETGKN
ncbi:MAG: hypothetical protein AABX38_04165 [Candidatus Micrarchaeota archaeon]